MRPAAKTVGIIAALDTKGEEARLIRDYIAGQGLNVLVVDVGVLGEPAIPAKVTRAEVVAAAGESLDELIRSQDKARAMRALSLIHI